MSADNVTSDTAEAGLYQTSYNAHSSSNMFDQVMCEYRAGAGRDNPQGWLDVFKEGVECDSGDCQNYGDGWGWKFQDLCKQRPAFAVETCALTLRNLCNHYGPIVRLEAELRPEADAILQQIQDYVDDHIQVA